jgi:hypothetical protein
LIVAKYLGDNSYGSFFEIDEKQVLYNGNEIKKIDFTKSQLKNNLLLEKHYIPNGLKYSENNCELSLGDKKVIVRSEIQSDILLFCLNKKNKYKPYDVFKKYTASKNPHSKANSLAHKLRLNFGISLSKNGDTYFMKKSK